MTQLHSRPASSASMLRSGHASLKHKPFASPKIKHPGVQRCVCQAIHAQTDTSQQTTHSDKRQQMTRQEEVSAQPAPRSPFNTGSMDITTAGATASLCGHSIPAEKTIVILRHGITTWNEEQRIQGSSEGSELTIHGQAQAVRCRNALAHMQFDSCFSSPIRRARSTTEIIWQGQGRDSPCIYLDSLKEAHLGWMEGMKQAEAATNHREEFATWRERPAEFNFDGRYPLLEVFDRAAEAWKEILEAPGSNHLVVTHKSMMRAFLCTALALPPTSFRAVDVHNGGVSIFRVNKRGEAMLTNMNMTSHMHHDDIYY
ncbi:TPA: hypothetical protein ACH3X1_010757 [Trebouxia sp. C0004]